MNMANVDKGAFVKKKWWVPLVGAGLIVATACSKSGPGQTGANGEPENKTVVVLLDKTASVKDQNGVFKEALKKIVGSLHGGDSFRLAEITGSSEDDFSFVVRSVLPAPTPYNPLTTNKSEYDVANKKAKSDRAAMRKTLLGNLDKELAKRPKAMTTDLFGAINTVGLYLQAHKDRKRILVILSDMIEEDSHWRFQKVKWTPALREKILAHEKGLGLLPDLSGVDVYVVGARGPRISVTQNIRFFWEEYFKDSHAVLPPDHYAHALLSWKN